MSGNATQINDWIEILRNFMHTTTSNKMLLSATVFIFLTTTAAVILERMSATREALVAEVSPPVEVSGNKVTIVGVGQVGMACAFSILTQVRNFLVIAPQTLGLFFCSVLITFVSWTDVLLSFLCPWQCLADTYSSTHSQLEWERARSRIETDVYYYYYSVHMSVNVPWIINNRAPLEFLEWYFI